tara:strand:+ start:4843 stop:5568 length:726 start_codon:yes stop_codon:yes gene_type:complete
MAKQAKTPAPKKSKTAIIGEVKTAIFANPILAYLVQLGSLNSKPNLKACAVILKALGLEDKYEVADTRQNCMNVLNRINQYRGTLFQGDIGSIQGHFSGTLGITYRNTPLGDIIATARKAIVVRAIVDIKSGIAPDYLRKPSKDGMKYCYHSMGHALKDLGFEKVPQAYVERLEMFERQIAVNAEAPADATVNIDNAPLASKEDIEKLTVPKIKTLLKQRGISTAGNKPELVERATVELVA